MSKDAPSLRKAVVIQFGAKYLNVIIQIGLTMILARLLAPEVHGTMAIVTVFISLFSIISNMGISAAVVQYRDLDLEDCSALFSFTLFLGLGLLALFCLVSLPISLLYSDAMLVPYMCFGSLSVLFNAINMVPNGLLMREKRFMALGLRLVISSVVSGAISVVLAMQGFGVYALVASNVLQAGVSCMWNLAASHIKLGRWHFMRPLRRIFKFSAFQFGSQLVQYFARHFDNMAIGFAFGNAALGVYDKGYKLAKYPIEIIPSTLNPVLKSFFSAAQDDAEAFFDLYFKVEKALSVCGCFITAFCVASAEGLILLAFGDQWTNAIPVFRWLSVSIVFQMVNYVVFSVLEGLKRTDYLFRLTLITTAVIIGLLLIGCAIGNLELTAALVSLGFVLFTVPNLYYVIHKAFGKSVVAWLKGFAPEFISGIVVLVALFALDTVLPCGPIATMFINLGVAVVIYALLMWRLGQLGYLKMLVRGKKKK